MHEPAARSHGVVARRRRATFARLTPLALLCVAASACPAPKVAHSAMPTCEEGPFAAELSRYLPRFSTAHEITLTKPESLKWRVEPGCMVPFRDEDADEHVSDVGRVSVSTRARNGDVTTPIGRGHLFIGRGGLYLPVRDDAGEDVMLLVIQGHEAMLRRKGQKTFHATLTVGPGDALPLPIDALIAALEGCKDDVRLGASEDADVIEARRGPFALWRTRWLDTANPSAVDTSTLCGEHDALLAWRSSAGDIGWSITVASARAPVVLAIAEQVRVETKEEEGEVHPDFRMSDE